MVKQSPTKEDLMLSEEDIKLRYITPAITGKGWSVQDISMEAKVKLTDGKINLRGNLVARGKAKYADYMLFYNRYTPIAIIEAKDANHSISHGMQQAKEYAEMMDIPFAYSSNGFGFQEYDFLTGIKRTELSVPTRYLLKHDLLAGRILDYGCGFGFDTDELKHQGYDITGYDYYYRPDYPEGKFDTIICNYVLNVLEPYAQAEVLMNVTNLLSPKGRAYFAVRRDLEEEGFRLHAIHKQYTYQCNVILPYKSLVSNKSYELYEYQHFNKLPRKEGEKCPFCKLSRRVEIICETATCVAFYDGYPVSPGHALIIPKRHVASYFDLTNHEREAMNVVLQYVKQKVDERYHPDGYNVGINVGEHAGQSVFHCHMHLIPRYKGDVPNPKGGVMGVIPSKQKY